jgi:uncharacterized membrane protein HdeD (DUF308 family)
MSKQFDVFMVETPDILAMHWGWAIALGCAVALLGAVAIWKANRATTLYVQFLGALAFLGAFAVLLFSVAVAGYWTEFFVHVLWAVLLGVAGLIMLLRPAVGAEAITLMLAAYFLLSGVLTIGFAASAHVDRLWIYVVEGLINAGLGVLLLAGWPFTGLWAIGIFVGVDLFLSGCAIAAMGLGLRAISEG